ncbi:MAG: V-type ATP synthase subunit F [Oscillospiraceae bacterium]|nr:V-type ATP synthase subunit F [Oscillospiraceae bacterium]
MYKIAVMGAYDSVYGFAALGLSTFPAETHEEGKRLLRQLSESDYAVIYITEALAALLPEEIGKLRNRITPAIILIPGISGNTGHGVEGVKKSVEQAVGSDILFSNQ